MKLSGQTIFITGGTSGIGLALAKALAAKGNQVIVAGRRGALLQEISARHPGIDTVVMDVADAASVQRAATEVLQRHPRLNVLINNAGIMPFDDVASAAFDEEQAARLVGTNLLGPARVSAAFVEHLKRQPQAWIVNNTSVLAFLPLAGNALYSATKAALHSYTLSQRFKLRGTSVRVLEIAPPWVDTDLVYRSGDPRAMPLDAFIEQTLAKLATDAVEVIVDAVLPIRANQGANEYPLIEQFNLALEAEPIPVAA